MRRGWKWLWIVGLITMSCSLLPPAGATDTAQPPTVTPTAADTSTPGPTGPCEATAAVDVTVYSRPNFAADVFGVLSAATVQPLSAQTGDGWYGFDPGVAQAANIGSFRLRWVNQADVSLSGDCGSLPVVWAPPIGVCFDMPMEDVDVHADANAASAIVAVLHVEEFAAVLGVSGTGWAKVDLSAGNTGSSVVGWLDEATLNMNGPCDSLPIVS